MGARGKDFVAVSEKVLQVEREAAAFFEKAHVLVSDPRVREIFDRLADAKREQLRSLEERFGELALPVPAKETQKGLAYPLAEFEKAECYVCGYSTEVGDIPESCPRCGASRYAFEKEIDIRKAWEIAEHGSYMTLNLLRQAEEQADPKARGVFAEQIGLEQKLLDEARKQLEGTRRR